MGAGNGRKKGGWEKKKEKKTVYLVLVKNHPEWQERWLRGQGFILLLQSLVFWAGAGSSQPLGLCRHLHSCACMPTHSRNLKY